MAVGLLRECVLAKAWRNVIRRYAAAAWLALGITVTAVPASASPAVVAAADAVIGSLSPAEAAQALAVFASPDRCRSRLTPGPRGGLLLSRMDGETREAGFTLLTAALGTTGGAMVEAIIERERILGMLEARPDYRDPGLYALALFGRPGSGRWGFRFEGHHLSINHTYDHDILVSVTPLALGANPERHEAVGVPLTVLTPLYERAAMAAVAGDGRPGSGPALQDLAPLLGRIVEIAGGGAILAETTADGSGRTYAAALSERSQGGRWRFSPDGFQLDGDDFTLWMRGLARNHVHLVLKDARTDFAGCRR